MMVSKMKEAAQKKQIEAEITAMSESSFDTYDGQTDVLLLGPQISYLEQNIRKKYEPKGIKVSVIEAASYGMMDGERVLNKALEMIEK